MLTKRVTEKACAPLTAYFGDQPLGMSGRDSNRSEEGIHEIGSAAKTRGKRARQRQFTNFVYNESRYQSTYLNTVQKEAKGMHVQVYILVHTTKFL